MDFVDNTPCSVTSRWFGRLIVLIFLCNGVRGDLSGFGVQGVDSIASTTGRTHRMGGRADSRHRWYDLGVRKAPWVRVLRETTFEILRLWKGRANCKKAAEAVVTFAASLSGHASAHELAKTTYQVQSSPFIDLEAAVTSCSLPHLQQVTAKSAT